MAKRQARLKQYQQTIKDHHNDIYCPEGQLKYNELDISGLDIYEHTFNNKDKIDYSAVNIDIPDISTTKCIKVNMYVSNSQHIIFQNWFNSDVAMYNETINFIKNHFSISQYTDYHNTYKESMKEMKNLVEYQNILEKTIKNLISKSKKVINKNTLNDITDRINDNKIELKSTTDYMSDLQKIINESSDKLSEMKQIVNYQNLRTNYLKDIRNKIVERSGSDQNNRIRVHILDCAIKHACTSYKSCITNYIEGNIKKFNIRRWRYTKVRKILEFENRFIQQFNSNYHICPAVFGEMTYEYNREDYKLTHESVKILYDSETNKYTLLVNKSLTVEKSDNKRKCRCISCDMGIRTFCTGLGDNCVLKMGTNTSDKIKYYLKKIDKVDKSNLSKKQKNKINSRWYLHIKNLVDDLHWKTIDVLTHTADIVIIGKLSMKEASSKDKSILTNMTKRIGLRMRHFEFRQRLKYKCSVKGVQYKEVHEGFTTAVCNMCSEYNDKVGSNKIFKCEQCKVVQERDPHGAKGIKLIGIYQ